MLAETTKRKFSFTSESGKVASVANDAWHALEFGSVESEVSGPTGNANSLQQNCTFGGCPTAAYCSTTTGCPGPN